MDPFIFFHTFLSTYTQFRFVLSFHVLLLSFIPSSWPVDAPLFIISTLGHTFLPEGKCKLNIIFILCIFMYFSFFDLHLS
jgi:hypothetical protein